MPQFWKLGNSKAYCQQLDEGLYAVLCSPKAEEWASMQHLKKNQAEFIPFIRNSVPKSWHKPTAEGRILLT